MTSALSQMQMLYVAEEDRILFRLNSTDGQEFRFWLTRRYTLLLIKVLRNHADDDPDISIQETPEAKQAIKEFKQEKLVEGANFESKFEESPNSFPLGENVQLAFKLSFNVSEEKLHLSIQPKAGQGINFVISREINASMIQLLRSAAEKGGWKIAEAFEVPDNTVEILSPKVVN